MTNPYPACFVSVRCGCSRRLFLITCLISLRLAMSPAGLA
jgi:hypothetical protein